MRQYFHRCSLCARLHKKLAIESFYFDAKPIQVHIGQAVKSAPSGVAPGRVQGSTHFLFAPSRLWVSQSQPDQLAGGQN